MKLNTKSWHYRMWAGSYDSYRDIPEQTDLCHYCHRVFWQLVLRAFLGFLIAWLVGLAGVVLYIYTVQGLYHHTVGTLIGTAIAAALIVGVIFYNRWLNGKYATTTEAKTLAGKWLGARKERICPVVEFE